MAAPAVSDGLDENGTGPARIAGALSAATATSMTSFPSTVRECRGPRHTGHGVTRLAKADVQMTREEVVLAHEDTGSPAPGEIQRFMEDAFLGGAVPKKNGDIAVPSILAASAAPAAIGIVAATIGTVPRSRAPATRCIEPPMPRDAPVSLPRTSASSSRSEPEGEEVGMRTMGTENTVTGAQVHHHRNRYCLLSDREMTRAADHAVVAVWPIDVRRSDQNLSRSAAEHRGSLSLYI